MNYFVKLKVNNVILLVWRSQRAHMVHGAHWEISQYPGGPRRAWLQACIEGMRGRRRERNDEEGDDG